MLEKFTPKIQKLALFLQREYFEILINNKLKPMFESKKLGIMGIASAAVLLAVFLSSDAVFAHPGNTAADGCHYCRTNCDKWGVAWNQRHCHGGSAIPAPAPKPKPTPAPIPALPKATDTAIIDTTIDGKIRGKINEVKNNYSKNHDGFRESLIKDIVGMVGSQANINRIGYFVYTMLPDVKAVGTTENNFTCNCSKTCPQISTCEEAQYQLNHCGCTVRDADHDGIACDNECQ